MIPMKLTPLSALATVSAGQSAPKGNEFSEDGTPFVRAGSLDTLLSGKSESDLELVSDETAKRRKLKLYPKGTVLFAKSGMSATKDRIYVLQSPAYVVSHLAVLIPRASTLANYLRLVLKAFPPSSLIKDPAYPAISLREIEDFKIPVPEQFDDQKRIAHLLGKVEELIVQRKQHLQQLDELLKSVFLEMFGDPVRNERGWETMTFNQIGQFKSGGTPSKNRNDFWDGSFPWVSPKDMKVAKIKDSEDHISEMVFEETTLKRITPNHLLIVVRGMILAHSFPVAINTVDIAINQDMKAIKPKNGLNVVYLQHCLTSLKRQILKLISTAGHGTKKFDSNAMEKLYIPVPPPGLQNKFVVITEKVENIKSLYQQSLTDLENLYGALSQQAFKGELDLSRVPLQPDSLSEYENEQDEAVAPISSVMPEGIKIKLEGLNAINEKTIGLKDIARAARASSLIDSEQFDIVKQAAAQLAAYRSPIEQLKNMPGIASAMEQLESVIKPLNLSQYGSIAKTAELARSMASSISKSDLSWLDQQQSEALKYANAPFESMRLAMEKVESLNYGQVDTIAKSIGFANNLRVPDLHDEALRNSTSASSAISEFESLQRKQLESARKALLGLDQSKIVPTFDTSISRAYLDAQKAMYDPLADIRNVMGSTASAYDQYLAGNSLFYAEDILGVLSDAAEPLSFDRLIEQLNELATVDVVGYEAIKSILFDLLTENQVKQSFDPEKQILLFSIAENGSEQ